MDDEQIIELLWQRSEQGLQEVGRKYRQRSLLLAAKLLGDPRDAEECISDALHILWQRIPPERPDHLWAYFSRILRNISCSRLDYRNAQKRMSAGEICLHELEGCLPGGEDPQLILEAKQTVERIDQFLEELSYVNRVIFVRRYYYFDSCGEIGKKVGMTRGAVNTRLHRLREELRRKLEKEGVLL